MHINSDNFVFTINMGNKTKHFTASLWNDDENNNFLPLSSFGKTNNVTVKFTPGILGLYDLKFSVTDDLIYAVHGTMENNRYAITTDFASNEGGDIL